MSRAFILLLDSFGLGATPDAAKYGDAGANTFGHIASTVAKSGKTLKLPNMERLGLGAAAHLASGEWATGFDQRRLNMLLAVLEKRGGLKVSACDAYLNIVGGLSLDEPAADLAAVIALASSYLDRPVPADLVAIGEVGLTGELRRDDPVGTRSVDAEESEALVA